MQHCHKQGRRNMKRQDNEKNELKSELEAIKKLLILQLVHSGISHGTVAKAAGMSTKTLYKFIPKNIGKEN